MLLWSEADLKGYTAPIWLTYRQVVPLGAQVRTGEHGSLVVYADRVTKTETNAQGLESEREIAFMKGYTVFNVEQVDGLPGHFYASRKHRSCWSASPMPSSFSPPPEPTSSRAGTGPRPIARKARPWLPPVFFWSNSKVIRQSSCSPECRKPRTPH